MATIQQLIDDINLRYRNTFTNDQKIVWMNEEQRLLFEIFEIESAPYAFTTVVDIYLYPIPTGVEIEKIKVITLQINDQDPPLFKEIHFRANDDYRQANISDYWYTIVQNNFYLNIPGGPITDRNVYIYCDTVPTEISSASLSVEPTTPKRFQEILKLGTLERIAAARKDVVMKTNFSAEKEQMISDYEWNMKMSEPEFSTPADTMPRYNRFRTSPRVVYVST